MKTGGGTLVKRAIQGTPEASILPPPSQPKRIAYGRSDEELAIFPVSLLCQVSYFPVEYHLVMYVTQVFGVRVRACVCRCSVGRKRVVVDIYPPHLSFSLSTSPSLSPPLPVSPHPHTNIPTLPTTSLTIAFCM